MSYIFEVSGTISYTDDSEKSFLAQDDIKDDVIIEDQQAIGDADAVIRQLIIAAGGELALPRTTPESGKQVRSINAKVSCWYTIGQESYEISVVSSDTTGLVVAGDGNFTQFMNAYGSGVQRFVNSMITGATIYGTRFANPVRCFLRVDPLNTSQMVLGIYSQITPSLELLTEKIISSGQEAAVIINLDTLPQPFVHARPLGDPPPQPVDINTQVSLLGVVQVDLVIGTAPSYNIGLTNPVFS